MCYGFRRIFVSQPVAAENLPTAQGKTPPSARPARAETAASLTLLKTRQELSDKRSFLLLRNSKSIETTAGGDTLQFTLFSNDNYVHPLSLPLTVTWSSRSFDFVAISTSSIVSFRSLVPSDPSAMILDNVSIEAVPEPSASVLAGVTACSLVFRRRRR
jgi:hypothetical protein